MEQNTVLIKKLNNNSFDLPKYQTEGSVGMDLSAFIENDILIKPNEREKIYFDSYDPAERAQVIQTQQKVIYYQKQQKHKDLYQILIVVDDFADTPDFIRKS